MKPEDLHPGDVLLFRPRGIAGYFVSLLTWSKYCHAAAFTGIGVAEVREFVGGRWLPITDYSAESIDVFRGNISPSTAVGVAEAMRRFADTDYSFGHGIAAWFNRRLPEFLRWIGECDDHGLHCSQAVSKAYRESGIDLCPEIPDWATTPGDLARSKKLQYVGRLES